MLPADQRRARHAERAAGGGAAGGGAAGGGRVEKISSGPVSAEENAAFIAQQKLLDFERVENLRTQYNNLPIDTPQQSNEKVNFLSAQKPEHQAIIKMNFDDFKAYKNSVLGEETPIINPPLTATGAGFGARAKSALGAAGAGLSGALVSGARGASKLASSAYNSGPDVRGRWERWRANRTQKASPEPVQPLAGAGGAKPPANRSIGSMFGLGNRNKTRKNYTANLVSSGPNGTAFEVNSGSDTFEVIVNKRSIGFEEGNSIKSDESEFGSPRTQYSDSDSDKSDSPAAGGGRRGYGAAGSQLDEYDDYDQFGGSDKSTLGGKRRTYKKKKQIKRKPRKSRR